MIYHRVSSKSTPNKYYYYDKNGEKVSKTKNPRLYEKLISIYVPPAYRNVELFPYSKKVIAKGLDDKNRIQYLYNPSFVKQRQDDKNCKVANKMLKVMNLEKKLRDVLKKPRHPDFEISIAFFLITECHFRIGNPRYTELYNSYGISTLLKSHFKGDAISFIGKKGVRNRCEINNPDLLKALSILKYNQQGINLFSSNFSAQKMNLFLKNEGGITTKDLRTLKANELFLRDFRKIQNDYQTLSINQRKQILNEISKKIAENLHNTSAVCKKNYIMKSLYNTALEKPHKLSEGSYSQCLRQICKDNSL